MRDIFYSENGIGMKPIKTPFPQMTLGESIFGKARKSLRKLTRLIKKYERQRELTK